MNMTPTCVCDRGSVAVGSLAEDGTRLTNCVSPSETVPPSFYEWRLPDLPAELPGGREVVVPPPTTVGGGGCSSTGAPAPASLALFALVGLLAIRRRK
jgi:MYXO-CTERM domain-containing protein